MESTAEQVGVRELLEAGVHFGHQAKRWNPKMKRYIFAERAGVHIIDLDQTLTLLDRALKFIRSVAEAGQDVLFVGTKKQAQITITEQAMRCGQPYVAERYIGGMLTNFRTIRPRIEYFKELSARIADTPEEERGSKEWFALDKEYQKLRRNFAGITEMERLPGALFVIDPKREELMVREANRLKIPVVALTDTNCDPEVIDYVVPGNDDAIRAINLITKLVANAVLEGRGEEEIQTTDRPVPPVVEEARAAEEGAPEEAPATPDGEPATAAAVKEPEAAETEDVSEQDGVADEPVEVEAAEAQTTPEPETEESGDEEKSETTEEKEEES